MNDLIVSLQEKAAQGDAEAMFELGKRYRKGDGIDKDTKKAVDLFLKAIELGHAGAQNNLGLCYYNGEGVEQDLVKAAECYRKAAEQGYISAQLNLGICYDNGDPGELPKLPLDMKVPDYTADMDIAKISG